MVTLENLRKDMEDLYERDSTINAVEIRADSLDEALADASVQFNTKVSNLEYEILEKGFNGVLGLAKKPWLIKVYQNPETLVVKKKKGTGVGGVGEESEEEKVVSTNGMFYIHHFGDGIWLKVVLPEGEGMPVNVDDVINDLKRPDTKSFDEEKVKEFVKKGTDGKYEEIGSYDHVPSNNAVFVVDIAKDEMTATATISAPSIGGADISPEEIKKALKQQGVLAGISDEKIQNLVDAPVCDMPVVVAEAILPVNGRDAYIAYNFQTDRSKLKAKESASGQIDFKELNLIQNVVEGQPLAQKMLAEKGKAGKTLFGRYLEATNGKDIELPLGNNVKVDTDGRTILAAVNGQVLIVNGKINVEPVIEYANGVNIKTGNVSFLGTVIVKGNVDDGFDIKARGNIEVSGSVGSCNIEADGDIIVSQGIIGRDVGKIICGGTLWAKFIQNATIRSEANVIVSDSIMNSSVSAQKKILLRGKRAQITGGHLVASELIAAKNIGSDGGGTETILEVGFDPKAKQRLTELQEMQNGNLKILDDVELNISSLENIQKTRRSLPKEKEESLRLLMEQRDALSDENDKFNEEISQIQAHLRELKNVGKVSASGTVYAGVKVYVRDEKDEVKNDTKSVTFFYEDGFVRRGKFEEPNLDDVKGPDGYSSN